MIRRYIIFSVLYPEFDDAVAKFRKGPTRRRLSRLRNVALAMECAQHRPLGVLTRILRDVHPKDYVRQMCSYKG